MESPNPSKLPRRRQATLYLDNQFRESIESIRARFNPEQSRLIGAHVTLCREDEINNWDEYNKRISDLERISVTLCFGELIRQGNFVYLPTTGSNDSFHELRNSLLATDTTQPRKHQPHLTLIHPRNGTCSDHTFAEIQSLYQPFEAEFNCVTLIEQSGDKPWRDLVEYP